MLLFSSSRTHTSGMLDYAADALRSHLQGVSTLTFVPYARPGGMSWQAYTQKVKKGLGWLGIVVKGLDEYDEPHHALAQAEAIYVGGGNTFVLLDTLYRHNLMATLRLRILEGVPYVGSSAGTNIAGLSISTTNDMPIIHPPALEALGLVPLNFNPHYLPPDPHSTHMGETRDTRIAEFHSFHRQPVLGLMEGGWLQAYGKNLWLRGPLEGYWFEPGAEPKLVHPDMDLSLILP